MKILVIDDMEVQRNHAVKKLAEHEVVTVGTMAEAKEAIKKGSWDMVLTDLSMPAEEDGQGNAGMRYVGESTPYGFIIAMLALRANIAKIAIVSNGQGDANHHSHPIFWAADSIHGEIIPGRFWAFTGYSCPHMSKENLPGIEKPWEIKDWADVVERISQ